MKKFLLLILLSFNLHAQNIEFVIASTPGSPDDLISRDIAKIIEDKTQLKFTVIYKPGAGKNIGYNYLNIVSKPAVIVSTDNIIQNKFVNKESYPEGILEKIEPIFYLGDFTNIVFVGSRTNITSIEDLIELSKSRDIRIGYGGYGTYSHYSLIKLCNKLLKCLEVPYKSGGAGMIDISTNTIDVYSLISFGVDTYLSNSSYRPILMLSTKKHNLYAVPTLPKHYKNLEIKNWAMLLGINISKDNKQTIADILKNENSNVYNKFGLWYEYKDPEFIWQRELKESK